MRAVFSLPGIISLVTLTLLLLPGCQNEPLSTTAPVSKNSPKANLAARCAIALSPHLGSGRSDREIIRQQQYARQAEDQLLHLEKLGWAFVAKARRSFDPGYYRLAEQAALCIENKQPDTPGALLLRGHVLHQLHQFKRAEILARKLVNQRGHGFDYGLLGDVLLEQGMLAEASEAYQQMIDQRPGPQAYGRAAEVRWLKGDLSGAIELMRLSTASRDPESGAWAHTRLALFEQQADHTDKALAHLSAALALLPDYAPALLARGRILLAEGKFNEAVSPLERAAQLNPLPEYLWVLSEALSASGKADQAAFVESQLMKHGPMEDPRTYALYLASTRQKLATALRLAKEELKAREDIFSLQTMAWTLFALGRPQEARPFSERALAEGTRDARLFYHAGRIAAALGRDKEAGRWLKKAAVIQQMLLPSERKQLSEASAALGSQKHAGIDSAGDKP